MKKKRSKKLSLRRETLAPLRDAERAVGGRVTGESFCVKCLSDTCLWVCF